ncbi:MAG: hypothetical protein RLZZ117_2245 [Cyanobacteriota bacterium]
MIFYLMTTAITVLALTTAALAGVVFVFRGRIRSLWRDLLSMRMDIQSLRKDITSVRKSLVIAQAGDQLRLPPLLPSEDGEELLLYNFFGKKKSGFFIEVGAYNGIDLSNTYFFEALGWHGLLIEPDPSLYAQCLRSRPHSKVLNVAASDQPGSLRFTTAVGREWLSFSGENREREQRVLAEGGQLAQKDVPCLTLNAILADYREPIDFISIDVEGHELSVLSGFDLQRFAPRVVLLEQSPSAHQTVIDAYLSQRGYRRADELGSNIFYVGEAEQEVFRW